MAFYLRILTFCVSFDNLIITTKNLNDDHSYELVSQIVSHNYDFSVRTMNDQSIGIYFFLMQWTWVFIVRCIN